MHSRKILLTFAVLASCIAFSYQLPRPERKDQTCANSRGSKMSQKAFVEEQINANKVVVFSKSYCPYCKKAKAALFGIIPESSVVVIELDQRGDGDSIQDALLEVTGRRSVPQVFIGGKFFGGGDETAEAAGNGKLSKALAAEGLV